MTPSYSTDKYNTNNNQQEDLGVIDFNPVNILMVVSEISSNTPKQIQGLKPMGLFFLGPTLIYTAE